MKMSAFAARPRLLRSLFAVPFVMAVSVGVGCAPRPIFGPAASTTTLTATPAIEKDPEVQKAFAGLTPAQRDLALRALQQRAQKDAPEAARRAKEGQSVDQIVAGLSGGEGGDKGKVGTGTEVAHETGDHGDNAPGPGNEDEHPPAPPMETAHAVPASWSPVRGPDNAKVTLIIFSDFQCPFCARVEPSLAEVRQKYGDSLRIVWRNQPLPFHPNALPAAEAAMAAGDQGKFWEMHDRLFADQRALDRAHFETYARELGLDMKKFAAALDGHQHKDEIEKDTAAGMSWGANGTPTSFINGRKLVGAQPADAFAAVIDEELAHADRLLARGVPMKELYQTMIDELPADPAPEVAGEEPVVTAEVKIAADAPSRGPRSAPVTIVEFSDFQCPFCGRVTPTLRSIEQRYKGKVRLVFMNQPLPFHDHAQLAAEAALAAGAQKKFWEMHDKLFANQSALGRDDLERYAGEIGLDMKRFKAALDDHTFAGRVHNDSEEGTRVGANGTPTFYINGTQLMGAQPEERFVALIDQSLKDKAGKGDKKKKKAKAE